MKIKSKFVPAPIVYDTVILEMNCEQGITLAYILERIGGDPAGPRGVCDELLRALRKVAIFPEDFPTQYTTRDSMYFVKTSDFDASDEGGRR